MALTVILNVQKQNYQDKQHHLTDSILYIIHTHTHTHIHTHTYTHTLCAVFIPARYSHSVIGSDHKLMVTITLWPALQVFWVLQILSSSKSYLAIRTAAKISAGDVVSP